MYLAHGIMAAIIERERSGEGQWVQTSLLEAMIAMLDFQATRWLIGGEVPPQAGNDHPTAFPMGVFPASDGMINIAASGDRMFRDFLKVIGAERSGGGRALPDAAGARKPPGRAAGAGRRQDCGNGRRSEWIEALNAVGVPCGPILTIDQVFADPQVRHLGMAQNGRERRVRDLTLVRSPVRLSRTSTSLRRAAPMPGGHTEEVLREYGYSADEIARFKRAARSARGRRRRPRPQPAARPDRPPIQERP